MCEVVGAEIVGVLCLVSACDIAFFYDFAFMFLHSLVSLSHFSYVERDKCGEYFFKFF